MVKGPGLDKLNLILPGTMGFKPDFARQWNDEKNDKLFKVTYGGMYLKAGDLRNVGLDLRISCGHRFHEKSGVKIEVLKMGEKSYSDVDAMVREIMDGDPDEADMPRVDLTADTEGIRVSEFEKALYLRNKQISQTEYGTSADFVERAFRRGKGGTVYFGRKRQTRVYDKTEHRKYLLNGLNRERTRHNQPTKTFQEEYGYDPSEIRTRIEFQCDDRGAEELWGIRRLGEIHRLADVDPFYNFRFAYDARGNKELSELSPLLRGYILLLRDLAENRSLVDARLHIRQQYDKADSCRRFVQDYEHLYTPRTHLTREFLKDQYRRSIIAQLAA